MAQEGNEAKREFEHTVDHSLRTSYKTARISSKIVKTISKLIKRLFNYAKTFIIPPFKDIQNDGTTNEIIKTDVEGGLTREQAKEILLKAHNDGVKVMVKEITAEDIVRNKTVHQQSKIYETNENVQKWEHRKDGFLGKIPVLDKFIEVKIKQAKENVEKDNMDNNDKRYIIFANKSKRDWLNESLIIARDKTLENKSNISNDSKEDYTKEIGLDAKKLEYDKNFTDIEVESYKSNYIEMHMTKEEYVIFDKKLMEQGKNNFGAKMFSGDQYVTVRFNKHYYKDYREHFSPNSTITKEIGTDDGKTLKQGNIPVITQLFKTEKDFIQYRDKELDGKDYIATHNADGSVTLKYSANIIINANKDYEKKQKTLMAEAIKEAQKQKEDKLKDDKEISLNKDDENILNQAKEMLEELSDISEERSK